MAEEAAAHHLLNVLEERDLNVDLDKVLAAFEDEHTRKEAAAWVNECLNEETLLTREELELYKHIQKKGLVSQYENSDRPTRPILDHELSSAIDSLQSSTAAIEEQCRVLEAQQEALMALQALDKPNLQAEHSRNERRRKEHSELARMNIAVDDVATTLDEQLADAQRDIDTDQSALTKFLTERLASDDKILTALPGIVSKIMAEPEVSEDEKSVDEWCKAIISFRTAEIKAKVDTAYLKGLADCSDSDVPDASEEELLEQKASLQAELETLHSEVASVAEMVVDHELRKPITDTIERRDRDQKQAKLDWSEYVLSTLDFMAKRLEIVSGHAKNINEFQHALGLIREAAAKHKPEPVLGSPKSTRKRTLSRPNPEFSPAIKLKPTKGLDLPPALQDALRHASIPFNQESIGALGESLVKATLEREEQLSEHFASASESTHEKLSERLAKADADLQEILDAIYSETKFKTVSLIDKDLEKEMKNVEKKVEDGQQRLLAAEAESLRLEDPRVRAFVEKHG